MPVASLHSSATYRLAPILGFRPYLALREIFTAAALLGQVEPPEGAAQGLAEHRVLLNVDSPQSAVIIGSTGSGKTHTLACLIENSIMLDPRLGELDAPGCALACVLSLLS